MIERGSSQSAPEHSLLLGTPPIIKKILTTPKLGPKKTVLVIAFRIAMTHSEKEGGEGDYSEERKKAFNTIHRQF